MTEQTISYYNANADAFIEGTSSVDVSHLYAEFESLLSEGASVLDVGCGSGRDLKHFAERGYQSLGLEPSSELAEFAAKHSGQDVVCTTVQDIDWCEAFDGIWCCASLLHVPKEELGGVFQKLGNALKRGGVMYVSFKYGDQEVERNGRFFSDLNEQQLECFTNTFNGLQVLKTWLTGDARPGREHEQWLNALLVKEC